ncbi:hypothetical protein EMPS_04578 [Entomortierella parvispora]|uniref:Uncharacterized protein n=1 Tax=Entomortierella parvispora TaxID=205924 RepID=A0A9P3LVI9_9FUNG|nr:hypothetical protein EMPS_04578 [Entomortierella parvispora]
MFPILCFSYRYLDRFEAISLSVQRARIYIMLAGSGLCCLVAAQLLMVHIVNNPHNSTYNRMTHLPPPSQLYGSLIERNTNVTGNPNHHLAMSLSAQIPNEAAERMQIAAIQSNPSETSMDEVKVVRSQDQMPTTQQSNNEKPIPRVSSNSRRSKRGDDDGQIAVVRDSDRKGPRDTVFGAEGESAAEEATTTPGYNLAGVHTIMFISAQTFLIFLLGILFLAVLIMTEFVLDKEDEDLSRTRSYFWGRVIGIGLATVISAVHGSFLTGYVLLDGQSDWIAKAAVGTILAYWFIMSWAMNKLTEPLPY